MITVTKQTDQIYLLRDGGGFFVNLVLGKEKALVFDTGCGIDDMMEGVRRVTDLPLLVIASHGHFDHIGGSYAFEKVYLAQEDRVILEEYNEDVLKRWIEELTKADGSSQKEKKQEQLDKKEKDWKGKRRELPDLSEKKKFGYPDWPQIAPLDFDHFNLGDLCCEVIPLPGHTKGSVGIYIPDWKLLLSGDALTPVMCLNFQNHGTIEEQYETLKKVQNLDFEYFLTSHHEKMFSKDIIRRMIGCVERSQRKRKHAYQYPYPPYAKGWFYLDSVEEEPVGIVTAEEK